MVLAAASLLNSAGSFVLGIVLSALLGPSEFGRFAMVSLAAMTLAGALFDWLRFSSSRFSGERNGQANTAASLEAAYLGMIVVLFVGVGLLWLAGIDFGFGSALLWLTPMLTVVLNRIDYSAALFRARSQDYALAAIVVVRQFGNFTIVVTVAYLTRSATLALAASAVSNLLAVLALSAQARVPGARLRLAERSRMIGFIVYAKPIVASLFIYGLIALINRHIAFERLGAAATGQLSLAFDLGQRLFQALYAIPELLLFQLALRREREEGRAAAEAQIAVNIVLVLAVLVPVAVGYLIMAPTFEALVVPEAYRGKFVHVTWAFGPGMVTYCALLAAINPVFQLAKRTWLITLAAGTAIVADLGMLVFADAGASIEGLARAYSVSLCVACAVSTSIAFRNPAVRPRLSDIAAIAGAAALMAIAVRPLNDLSSPVLAAGLSIVIGGAVFGSVMLACDVGGLRRGLSAKVRATHSRFVAS